MNKLSADAEPEAVPEARPQALEVTLTAPLGRQVSQPLQMYPGPYAPSAHSIREGNPPDWWQGPWREDQSLPRPIRFTWQASGAVDGPVRYDLSLRAGDGSGETFSLRGLVEPAAEVENLRVGVLYSWWVRARRGRRVVGRSAVAEFFTHPALPRWIRVDGVTNVRDLGGWPLPDGRQVRQGLFFRGSEMNSHCQITRSGMQMMIDQLGIRTDIDLRGKDEDCQPVLDPSRVTYFNVPLSSYDMIASPEYARSFRSLFGLFASPERYPLYLHCWGGADRTGTAAFLVGALLGMRREDLVADYELTSLSIWGERRADSEAFSEMLQILSLFGASGSSLQAQVERYLHVVGVTSDQITAIRGILTGV